LGRHLRRQIRRPGAVLHRGRLFEDTTRGHVWHGGDEIVAILRKFFRNADRNSWYAASIGKIRDGTIAFKADYWDRMAVLRQLTEN